jgi:DNA-binding LytR/AlgR family response regulator
MESKTFFLKSGKSMIQLDPDNVTHIQVDDYLCTVYCIESGQHHCCQSLKELAKQLPTTFLRISRSCIINPDHIQEIDFQNKAIRLNDELWLPVSRAEWKRLSKDLNEDFSKSTNAQIDKKTKERIDLYNPKHLRSNTASPLPSPLGEGDR